MSAATNDIVRGLTTTRHKHGILKLALALGLEIGRTGRRRWRLCGEPVTFRELYARVNAEATSQGHPLAGMGWMCSRPPSHILLRGLPLLPGEHLSPAQARVLRALMAEEGRMLSFAELGEKAAIVATKSSLRALLHRHVHYVRRAIIDDCWIADVYGEGYIFRRRATGDARAA